MPDTLASLLRVDATRPRMTQAPMVIISSDSEEEGIPPQAEPNRPTEVLQATPDQALRMQFLFRTPPTTHIHSQPASPQQQHRMTTPAQYYRMQLAYQDLSYHDITSDIHYLSTPEDSPEHAPRDDEDMDVIITENVENQNNEFVINQDDIRDDNQPDQADVIIIDDDVNNNATVEAQSSEHYSTTNTIVTNNPILNLATTITESVVRDGNILSLTLQYGVPITQEDMQQVIQDQQSNNNATGSTLEQIDNILQQEWDAYITLQQEGNNANDEDNQTKKVIDIENLNLYFSADVTTPPNTTVTMSSPLPSPATLATQLTEAQTLQNITNTPVRHLADVDDDDEEDEYTIEDIRALFLDDIQLTEYHDVQQWVQEVQKGL